MGKGYARRGKEGGTEGFSSAGREGDWGKWERKAPKWLLSDAKTEEPFQGDEGRDFLRIGSH